MTPAEEFRYLVLAIQREGNKLLAAGLRPLDLTPSQAEVLRVLADHGPLTLSGLGELLVCETGSSPSRLVDRLVGRGLVTREVAKEDRRYVALALTSEGRQLARRVLAVERGLYDLFDQQTADAPVSEALDVLRQVASAFPAGAAVARRALG